MVADKDTVARLLRTARGQLDGLLKMVEEDRYCVDISNQLLATIAILKRVNREVLDRHLQHCVLEALDGKTQDAPQKVDEIMQLVDKLSR
ncbi:MAG: metal-sensing transcriptional repressor [Oscillospiraceae bacterium]|nr:metal-sensing transcriptional repressor [Oscillospiraceae bacterium]MDD4368431.1 metal-sensing transcriptional repressor [Oscillospiraceae bacterium]